MANNQRSEKLSRWQKVAYGMGDIYGGGSTVIVGFFYLVFLTDVVRISPGLAGIVILVSRVYDAITDPLEGIIFDRTRTRIGRRRPYLVGGIPLVCLSFFLLFYPVGFESEAGRFVFVILAYLFFSTIVSLVMINYNALQAELTLDYNERAALSAARIFFSTVSSIVCAVLSMEIVRSFPDVRSGWIAMGLTFGAFFALPFIATVAVCRERPEFQHKPEPFRWRQTIIEPFRIRTFRYALLMFLFAFAAMDTVSSVVVFFMKNYLGRGEETSFVLGTLLVAQAISLPFYIRLSKRTSKRTGYVTGALIWMVAMLFSFLIVPEASAFTIYVFAAIVGLGIGGIVVMMYAIFPDLPDVDELESGKRREAKYFALVVFMRKLSSAVALFFVAQTLELAGYIPPIKEVVEGATRLVEQPQSAAFILGLRLIFALIPIIFLAFGLIFAFKYPLTSQVHQRLNRILAARRKGEPETPDFRQETEALSRLLIKR
jgi:oligogalacturonide transporter